MQDFEACENCHRQFPSSKIHSHFSYCVRNIKKCPQCPEMIDMNHLEWHIQEFHAKVPCTFCKKQIEQTFIDNHKLTCDLRTVICQYCEQSVPLRQFDEHQEACGARTSPCPICERPVVLKNLYQHASTCTQQPAPPPVAVTGSGNSYQDYINKERSKLGMQPRVISTTVTVRAEQPSSVRVIPIQKVSIKSSDLKSNQPKTIRYQPSETQTRTVYYKTESGSQPTTTTTTTRVISPSTTPNITRVNSINSGNIVEPTRITYITHQPVVKSITYVTKEPVITRKVSEVKYEQSVKVYGGIDSIQTSVRQNYPGIKTTTRVPGFQDEDEQLQRALLQSMMMQ